MLVRAAAQADAKRLGEIHVRAWQRAYRGEFPDAYLDGLQPSQRAELWTLHIPSSGVIVSEDEHAHVIGFASCGPSPDPAGAGELFAMNVDPDHWGEGHGSALLAHVVSLLAGAGYPEAVLWSTDRTLEHKRSTADTDGGQTDP